MPVVGERDPVVSYVYCEARRYGVSIGICTDANWPETKVSLGNERK